MKKTNRLGPVLSCASLLLFLFSCKKDDLIQNSTESSGIKSEINALSTTGSGTTVLYRINTGGGQVNTSLGTFAADNYRTSAPSNTFSIKSTDIQKTVDDVLYLTERYGTSFGYAFPVNNGNYTVKLHFAEVYFTATGRRKFDVKLEGNRVLDNYDIVARAGAKTAVIETFTTSVADGNLNIDFSSKSADGGLDNAKISAIEILSSSTTTTTTTTPTTTTSSSTSASLLFKSGFESGVVQEGPTTGTTETYLNLTGTDNSTGYAWPIRTWNGSSQIQAMAYNGYKSLLDGAKARSGSRSLYQEVTTGHTADGGSYNQLALQWLPANAVDQQKDLYYSAWYYLQPDLADKLVYTSGGGAMSNGLWGDWRALFEIKTGGTGSNYGGDLRHIVYIMKNSSGGLHWELNVDNNANGGYPCNNACWPSRVKNTTVAVPLGQWFKFETFLHRSTGQDGRWLVKVNGETLVDRYGPNMGSQNMPMNRIFLSQVYSNGKAPQYQWVDDIEIHNAMPY